MLGAAVLPATWPVGRSHGPRKCERRSPALGAGLEGSQLHSPRGGSHGKNRSGSSSSVLAPSP